jgi:hypothetical protein
MVSRWGWISIRESERDFNPSTQYGHTVSPKLFAARHHRQVVNRLAIAADDDDFTVCLMPIYSFDSWTIRPQGNARNPRVAPYGRLFLLSAAL